MLSFQEDFGISCPAASGNEGNGNAVCNLYEVNIFPTFTLIDPDRTILKQHVTPVETENFIGLIEHCGGIPSNCNIATTEHAEKNFDIYPNPAKDRLYLHDKDFKGAIRIYDACGNLALDLLYNNHTSIDISTLKSGLYIVECISNDAKVQIIKRLVVVD